MNALRAEDIHARVSWPAVLVQLGLDPSFVRVKKSGPCPACNGTDRFTFDNRKGRGDFICRGCGAGNGFDLLMRVHGWNFAEARRHVLEVAGIRTAATDAPLTAPNAFRGSNTTEPEIAQPSRRIRALIGSSCAVADCPDAVAYLAARGVWPLPEFTGLRAHVTTDYFEESRSIGKFAAIVAPVTDAIGELVTAHVTYLRDGKKLEGHEPRKLLTKTTGRTGCAVRLTPTGEVLGISEGIETALSASLIDGVPVWAALNTSLLAKFDPPAGVRELRIYADHDTAGMKAAAQLMQRLQGRVHLELRAPSLPHKDWNDDLISRSGIGKIVRSANDCLIWNDSADRGRGVTHD